MSPEFRRPPHRGGRQIIPQVPGARLGRSAPWAGLDVDPVEYRVADLAAALERRGGPMVPSDPGGVRASSAVLILAFDSPDGMTLLLTRRSPHMRSHAHEMAFPGGRRDPEDASLWATALREAHEEVALDPTLVTSIGAIDSFVTVGSASLVHPLVGKVESVPDLVASPAEVEAIRFVTVSELMDPGAWREEIWPLPGGDRAVTFFELMGDTLWGSSAAMTRQLLGILTGTTDQIEGGPG